MNVGIGVLTCNRPAFLEKTLSVIVPNGQSSNADVSFFVYDDASTNESVLQIINKYGLPYESEKTESIAASKNKILRRLYDDGADIILLFEDDFYINTPYVDLFCNAIEQSGFPHFVFDYKHNPVGETIKTCGDIVIVRPKFGTGCFGTFTRQLLETVGLFDEVFKVYGNEHMDYDNRCVNNGYSPCLVELSNLKPYISNHNPQSVLPDAVQQSWTGINYQFYDVNSKKQIPINRE